MRLVTGNDLGTGDVVWWTGEGWSRHIADAADAGVPPVEKMISLSELTKALA